MSFFDPRQSESGESGKVINYRNAVMDQCKLADELHITWSDTEYMSILDRKYAMKYLEMKAKAMQEVLDNRNKDKTIK